MTRTQTPKGVGIGTFPDPPVLRRSQYVLRRPEGCVSGAGGADERFLLRNEFSVVRRTRGTRPRTRLNETMVSLYFRRPPLERFVPTLRRRNSNPKILRRHSLGPLRNPPTPDPKKFDPRLRGSSVPIRRCPGRSWSLRENVHQNYKINSQPFGD